MPRIDAIELQQRREAFERKTARYRLLGFDRITASRFVVDAAGAFEGPALDVGTGKGITAISLAHKGVEVVSVDPDAEQEELAALLAEEAGIRDRIRFLRNDAASLPFEDLAFGCVASMDALHHLLDPLAVMREMERVLRPQGVLILADFTREGFELLARVHREEGREHPVVGVSLDVAQAFFTNRGYRIASRKSGHYHEVSVLIKGSGGI